MALITDKVLLNPKATASAPSGTEGAMYYDSTTNELKVYDTAWKALNIGGLGAWGGTRTVSGGYTFHEFTGSGTFTVVSSTLSCDIIVVGGGGAGSIDHGGGGGAGALSYVTGYSLSQGSYAVVIGAGGVASVGSHGSGSQNGGTSRMYPEAARGGTSSFGGSLMVSYGGGGGRGCCSVITQGGGDIGCSGGALRTNTPTAINKGTTTIGATILGNLTTADTTAHVGGGGGGAGGVGDGSTTGKGGHGARPVTWADAWGTDTSNTAGGGYFAGGGGGGTHSQDALTYSGGTRGGYGGGGGFGTSLGNCSTDGNAGIAGMPNTGGGGSGSGNSYPVHTGTSGAGGSGIVLIRYHL